MEAKAKFQEILEMYGGETANRSVEQLLEDPQLTAMKHFTDFVAKNWRDCFIPTLMNLGCQFVGGKPRDTEEFAVSLSLMNLSFRIWDDVIDETTNRTLRSTFVGKFGRSNALIYGGTISAKAFTILSKANAEKVRKEEINELIWNYWATMAKAETRDLAARANTYNASQKFSKIKEEAVNIRTALKIGAVLGNGSSNDIEELETYGNNLAVMLELLKDLKVSLNLTLELEEKLQSGQLSLLLFMAKEESREIQAKIQLLEKNCSITPKDMHHLIRVVLNSKSWAHFIEYFKEANIKCQAVLMARESSAAKTLIAIASNQYDIFGEIAKIKK
jgi:geranylgeranyl pyrophosphate synthase